MSIDITAVNTQAKATIPLVDPVSQALEKLKSAKTEKAVSDSLQNLIEARENLDEAIARLSTLCDQPPPTSFADFLSDVGDAAVATQRKLDEQNIRSVQLALASGQAPSGVFRLPSVKGEVKFGLSKTSGKKLGLVFYSRKTSEESRNEQSMQFEIVSTPPPPELLQRAARREAFLHEDQRRLDFVLRPELVPENRAEVLKIFRTSIPNYTENTALSDHLLSRIIILPALKPGLSFLLYADEQGANRVGIWQVDLGDGSLRVVWRLDSKGSPTEDIDPFRRWILALGKRQEELLKSAAQ